MDGILRKEWKFGGVVISDYNSFREMITHGVAENEHDAACLAINAGNDIEMMSATYIGNMESLIKEGKVSLKQIDKAVERVLKLKKKKGMFSNPYQDADKTLADKLDCCKEHRDLARKAAEKCAVLLKNDGVLPFNTSVKKVAVTDRLQIRARYSETGAATASTSRPLPFSRALKTCWRMPKSNTLRA